MRSLLRLIVWTLIVIGSAIGLARATAIRWWQVPLDDPWLAASVAPTLRPGDWVILWRLTRPTEGDLVKCPEPKASERLVVGRILGAANDEIEFVEGTVRLNGRTLPTERSCPSFQIVHPRTNAPVEQTCRVEDLAGHLYFRGGFVPDLPRPPSTRTVVVEPGRFFLVSDNRQFSFDSRDYGTVEAASCKETVIYRLWTKNGYYDPTGRFELVR